MTRKITIKENRILAVEGKDEVNFFKALLKYENIEKIQIEDIGGKDNFKNELPLIINMEGFINVTSLGFIRDAEQNKANSAFESICKILQENNLPIPDKINSVCEQNLKTGIFIMPNNIDSGMLEDLCLESIKDQPIFKCVNDYITCCQNDISTSKAKVQVYLASKKPIVNSLGLAAQKKYWKFDHKCFSDIKQFLHALYD